MEKKLGTSATVEAIEFFFPQSEAETDSLFSFLPFSSLRRSLFRPLSKLLKLIRCVDVSLCSCCRKGNGAAELASAVRQRFAFLPTADLFRMPSDD